MLILENKTTFQNKDCKLVLVSEKMASLSHESWLQHVYVLVAGQGHYDKLPWKLNPTPQKFTSWDEIHLQIPPAVPGNGSHGM